MLTDNVELDGLVEPDNPSNLRLDDSSTPTVINITWDRSEGISPAIITYQLIYSLSRVDGSSDSDVVMVRSVCCFVCSESGTSLSALMHTLHMLFVYYM